MSQPRHPVTQQGAAEKRRGLVLVYTGDGKGKTTAALGLLVRALGRNMTVGVIQFIKGKWRTGERVFAESLPGVDFRVMGRGFTWESEDISRDRRAASEAWSHAQKMIASSRYDIVILDELTYCFHHGFLELADVLSCLENRPAGVHVVVTGRNAPEPLLELADLVTEMKNVKHPYQRGRRAEPGIDY